MEYLNSLYLPVLTHRGRSLVYYSPMGYRQGLFDVQAQYLYILYEALFTYLFFFHCRRYTYCTGEYGL